MTWTHSKLLAIATATMALTFAGCSGDDPEDPPVDSGPVIKSFAADKTTIANGEAVTVSWNVEKANTVTIVATPGGTLVNASETLVGSMASGPLTADTTFKITATGAGGKTKEQMFTVTIDEAALAILTFTANPNPAPRGGTTELRWTTSGATRVVVKDGATTLYTAMASEVAQGFVTSPVLANPSYTFTLEATSATDETVTETVTVNAEAPPTITTFTVTPESFTGASQAVTITYAVTDASSLRLFQNGSEVPNALPNTTSGTAMITISTTTRFELAAASGGGEVRQSALVVKTVQETEPNDDYMTATDLASGAATGEVSETDVDFYKITVGENGNVFATFKNTDGTCPFAGYLSLYGSDGVEINAAFPFDPADLCPNIDPGAMSWAAGLAAGDYYISVTSLDKGGPFPYTLVVLIGTPGCGNRVIEGDELCDDGNTTAGDNCSATCDIETVSTINPPGGNVTLNLGPYVPNVTNDVRWISVVITQQGQSIEVTTGDVGGGCTIDTFLVLFSRDTLMGFNSDADLEMPDSTCAAIRFPGNTGAVDLAPGNYLLGVFNDDMVAGASVFVNVTIINPACGNTGIEGTEQCDDGNTTSGDGCSATCQVEPLGMVMGPPGDQTFTGAIDPANQADIYTVTLTAPGYIAAQTFAPTSPTCTPTTTDTVISLLNSNFEEIDGNDDSGGVRCSNMIPAAGDDLAAGTYYVRVTSYQGQTVIPAYAVQIRALGMGCGNSLVEMTEACDDGNTAAGDGCSATCQVEPLGTVMGPPGDQTFTNELDPASEQDFYRVTLTGPGYITAQTFAPTAPNCTDADTLLAVLQDDFTVITTHDDNAGDLCSTIPATGAGLLAAGNYWVRVSGFGAAIPAYAVRIRALAAGCGNSIAEMGETCDDGNTTSGDGCSSTCQFEGMATAESEPNNTVAQADVSGATRNNTVILTGAITPVGDIDVYSFTITGNAASLRAQTHTVIGDVNVCEDIDTFLYLTDAAGMVIDSHDDIGLPTNACSLLDGINGANPDSAGLAPGTYYLEVHHYDDSEELPGYFLSVRLQ